MLSVDSAPRFSSNARVTAPHAGLARPAAPQFSGLEEFDEKAFNGFLSDKLDYILEHLDEYAVTVHEPIREATASDRGGPSRLDIEVHRKEPLSKDAPLADRLVQNGMLLGFAKNFTGGLFNAGQPVGAFHAFFSCPKGPHDFAEGLYNSGLFKVNNKLQMRPVNMSGLLSLKQGIRDRLATAYHGLSPDLLNTSDRPVDEKLRRLFFEALKQDPQGREKLQKILAAKPPVTYWS